MDQYSPRRSAAPMEASGSGRPWKTHLAELARGRREAGRPAEGTGRGVEGSQRGVSMATTSRYLNDRRYVTRKPIFSEEAHASIMKTPEKLPEEDKLLHFSRTDDDSGLVSFLTRSRKEPALRCDPSLPSTSKDDLGSPFSPSVAGCATPSDRGSVASPVPARRPARRSLTSSILEVQRLSPPLRPQLSSTVLYPTYTPLSSSSRRRPWHPRRATKTADSVEELCVGGGMTPHQVNYWACAIPRGLPPSPDRQAEDWNPNREYLALLDYTYPLRPGGGSDSSEFQGAALLQTDATIQDSGIEIDRCSPTSLSETDFFQSGVGRTGDPNPRKTSSAGLLRGTLPSGTRPFGSSSDSLDRDAANSAPYVPSTRMFPRPRCTGGDLDKEFRCLPEQLEELTLLSRQVREVTSQLSCPIKTSWESLEPEASSSLSSGTLPERREEHADEAEGKLGSPSSLSPCRHQRQLAGAATSTPERPAPDSEAARRTESDGGELGRDRLKEVEALMGRLGGLGADDLKNNQEQNHSLMQRIQVFCSHLQRLIHWLYAVSEKMDLLAAPATDTHGVRTMLADYETLQKEVSRHRPLTFQVLHSGQLLLSCIDSTSPVLRDTLLLIEKQSKALETRMARLFSSVLSAVDGLILPASAQKIRLLSSGPEEIPGVALETRQQNIYTI